MRILSLVAGLFLFAFGELAAQDKQYTSVKDNDPEAVALITSVRKKYDAYQTMAADFRLDIAFPNQPVETQKGTITRRGDEVRFKLGSQEGIINAEAAYIIQHGNKEVMINNLPDPDETSGVITPQTLFNFYEGDNFIVALQGQEVKAGRKLQIVELKPIDVDNSEFTKLRLLIDSAKNALVSVKAFSRDASSFTFHLDNAKGDVAVTDKTFIFSKEEFPGYHVEDLRY